MNLSDLANVSDAVKRRNRHLFEDSRQEYAVKDSIERKIRQRVRQSSKPIMNSLEQEFYHRLRNRLNAPIRAQSIKLKLCNGAFYKPDFFVLCESPVAFEVKGPREGKNVARGILALKFAAHEWPEIAFWLAWKDDSGQWQEQRILPT